MQYFSNEYTPTAVFQLVAQGTEEFLIKASEIKKKYEVSIFK